MVGRVWGEGRKGVWCIMAVGGGFSQVLEKGRVQIKRIVLNLRMVVVKCV